LHHTHDYDYSYTEKHSSPSSLALRPAPARFPCTHTINLHAYAYAAQTPDTRIASAWRSQLIEHIYTYICIRKQCVRPARHHIIHPAPSLDLAPPADALMPRPTTDATRQIPPQTQPPPPVSAPFAPLEARGRIQYTHAHSAKAKASPGCALPLPTPG